MCWRGLAMVALATMKRGCRPYSRAHSRCSRRSTSAVWHPNTPLRAHQLALGHPVEQVQVQPVHSST